MLGTPGNSYPTPRCYPATFALLLYLIHSSLDHPFSPSVSIIFLRAFLPRPPPSLFVRIARKTNIIPGSFRALSFRPFSYPVHCPRFSSSSSSSSSLCAPFLYRHRTPPPANASLSSYFLIRPDFPSSPSRRKLADLRFSSRLSLSVFRPRARYLATRYNVPSTRRTLSFLQPVTLSVVRRQGHTLRAP